MCILILKKISHIKPIKENVSQNMASNNKSAVWDDAISIAVFQVFFRKS